MRSRLSAAALLACALHAFTATAHAADVPMTGDAVEAAQVWDTFEHWLRAYEAGDLERIMAIFDPAVIFEFQGSPDADAAALRRDYEADLKARAPGTRWVPRVEEVHAEGSMAFVRSVWELDVAGKVRQRNRSLDVFHRHDGRWAILRSINYPEPAPSH
jgi:ketosteroid isomerase-like protein